MYLGCDVGTVSHQDGDGRSVTGPGGQVERTVAAVVAQVHVESVRLHVLGEPSDQVDL